MFGYTSIIHNKNFIHLVNSIYLLFSKQLVNLVFPHDMLKLGLKTFSQLHIHSIYFVHFKWHCYYRNVSDWLLSWELSGNKSISFLLLLTFLTWFLASAIPRYLRHQSNILESEHSKSSWSPFPSNGWTLWDVPTYLWILFIRNSVIMQRINPLHLSKALLLFQFLGYFKIFKGLGTKSEQSCHLFV